MNKIWMKNCRFPSFSAILAIFCQILALFFSHVCRGFGVPGIFLNQKKGAHAVVL